MSWFGSPEQLDRLAGRLASAAGEVRSQAAEVRASRPQHWRGPAAEAFAASVGSEARALDRAASELDDAAAALHRHAEAVRTELDRLRALERAAEKRLSKLAGLLS